MRNTFKLLFTLSFPKTQLPDVGNHLLHQHICLDIEKRERLELWLKWQFSPTALHSISHRERNRAAAKKIWGIYLSSFSNGNRAFFLDSSAGTTFGGGIAAQRRNFFFFCSRQGLEKMAAQRRKHFGGYTFHVFSMENGQFFLKSANFFSQIGRHQFFF